MAKIWYII